MNKVFLTTGLAVGLALLVLAALGGSKVQAALPSCNRYVVEGGSNSSDCSDPNNPCKTVQYALGRAATGNVICVADRTGTGYEQPSTYAGTIVITKSVTLDGAWTAQPLVSVPGWIFTAAPCVPQTVILGGLGNRRVISITGAIAPTIRCFTITGGDANGLVGDPDADDAGGGIYSKDAAPIILSNVITGNYGCDECSSTYGIGGGIYMLNAPATAVISGNVIDSNAGAATTLGWGGGIALRNSNAQVRLNTIRRNLGGTVGDGGGIYVLGGSPIIADNTIVTNTAAGAGVMGNGGGLFVQSSLPVTIERNLFQVNVGMKGAGTPGFFSRGGGIYYDGIAAVIRNNTLRSNAATWDQAGLGGGMYLSNLSASAVVSGNVVSNDNRASYDDYGEGGGLYLNSCQATVANNQIFGNTAASSTEGWGGGVYIKGGGGLLQGNVITGNLAMLGAAGGSGWGGGVAISNSLVILQDNRIERNEAASAPGSSGVGGGIVVTYGAPRLNGNEILSNTTGGGNSGYGGGLYLQAARPWLEGNTVLGNQAAGAISCGGGVRIAACPAFTLTNNIVARNAVSQTGSGVAIHSSAGQLVHNTIADNRAGDGVGILAQNSSVVTLTNTIIVSHTVGISRTSDSTATAQYTLFEGNSSNYNAGVSSANEVAGPAALLPNYHLRSASGAIDHATPLAWVVVDVDGDARPFGAASDVGADERTSACDRYVLNVDTTDVGRDCTDMTHPCRSVTYALGQALDGDRICIADHPLQPGPSVYIGTHTVNKSVTLDGAWQAMCVDPSDLTCSFWAVPCNPPGVTLDAQLAGRVIEISGNVTPTIQCLAVTGGQAADSSGGGIYANTAHPVISGCLVYGNSATRSGSGGGIALYNANNAALVGSQVYSNTSAVWGGGIYIYNSNRITIAGNRIYSNTADSGNDGGGVSCVRCDNATLAGNSIYRNTAGYGAGVEFYESFTVTLVNNVIADNRALAGAPGLSLRGATIRGSHNTIARNSGGNGYGVLLSVGDGTNRSSIALTNTIIVSQTWGVYAPSADYTATLNSVLWYSNTNNIGGGGAMSVTSAITGDPAFMDDGYHLGPGSAAIDAGVNAGVTTDIDGDPRPIGPLPDLGADERCVYVYLPLVARNY